MTIYAMDQQNRAIASDQFEVSVLPLNDAPVAHDISVSLNEDGIKSIIPDVEDIDTQSLEYTIIDYQGIPKMTHGASGRSQAR